MLKERTPKNLLLMGVCGVGKTAVGRLLADRLGAPFLDADDLHSAGNIRKLTAGTPLTDTDRGPWLDAVAGEMLVAESRGHGMVVACSALKRVYRDRLRRAVPTLRLVHLVGPIDLVRGRLAARAGHFMSAALLDSQVVTLEHPGVDEQPLVIDVSPALGQVFERIEEALEHGE